MSVVGIILMFAPMLHGNVGSFLSFRTLRTKLYQLEDTAQLQVLAQLVIYDGVVLLGT